MNQTQNNRFVGLATGAAFAGLFSYAVVFTVIPATINQIRDFYHVTPSVLGWLFRALMISFFAGVLIAGRFADRHGKLHSIWPGCVLMAIGMCIFVMTKDFRAALLSTLLMGFGGGAAEGMAMALISDLYTGPRRTSMANLSQAAFAVGAITCPFAVGWLLRTGIAWQASYYGGAAICVASAVLTLTATMMGREDIAAVHEGSSNLRAMLSDRLVLLLAISIMLYVGAETGTANWLAVYFKRDLGSAPSLAAWSIALFWLGITLGRVIAGGMARRVSEISMMRWSLIIAAVFQALLLLLHSPVAGMAVVFILGVCLGPVYPTIASCSGAAYPGQSGVALGIVVAAGSLGGAIFPPTVGVIADHTGMRMAMWLPFIVLLANLSVLSMLRKRDVDRISHAC